MIQKTDYVNHYMRIPRIIISMQYLKMDNEIMTVLLASKCKLRMHKGTYSITINVCIYIYTWWAALEKNVQAP